jgi:hypothetical protein
MGASPPTGTLPTLICRVFLRIIMVRDYTLLLFVLHPSFAGLATRPDTFFNPHRMPAHGSSVCWDSFRRKKEATLFFSPNKKPLTNNTSRY